jgi:hypothetical protein
MSLRRALPLGCVLALLLPAIALAGTVPVDVVPNSSPGWRYKQVAHGTLPTNFPKFSFNDSAYAIGTAPFGSGACDASVPPPVTNWDANTDMLLRKQFTLGPNAFGLQVAVTIDNDVEVWVNGTEISGGVVTHEFCAQHDVPTFQAPDSLLRVGTNVVAVRAIDRGDLTYFDARLTMQYDGCTVRGMPDIPGKSKTIKGPLGAATICGTSGNDTIIGKSFDDDLIGAAGNDSLNGGGGPDLLNGGDGTDTVTYASRTASQPVTAKIDGAADSGGAADSNGDTINTDVENLVGGAGADTLIGGAGKNMLTGGLGSDSLFGAGGNDTLKAKDGVVDAVVDCDGAPGTAGAADKASTDAGDPVNADCETVTH